MAVDAAQHAMNNRSSEIIKEINEKMAKCNEVMEAITTFHTHHIQHNHNTTKQVSTQRWNNITLDTNFRRSPNPYDQPNLPTSSTFDNNQRAPFRRSPTPPLYPEQPQTHIPSFSLGQPHIPQTVHVSPNHYHGKDNCATSLP